MLCRKPVLAFVLAAALLLALSPPSAALSTHSATPSDSGSFWGHVFEWLTVGFPGLDGGRRSPWSRDGGASDPDGKARTSSTPSGLRAVWGEEGPAGDPDGKPKATSTTSGHS
jgi:hypothetical protein